METAERTGREDGAGLLEAAIGYAFAALGAVTTEALGLPTPCRGWDLGMLLEHTGESVDALAEAAGTGTVRLVPGPAPSGGAGDRSAALVASLRLAAARLAGAWGAPGRPVSIGDRSLPAETVALTGAIEIAVHGWDIARATGRPRPLPPVLAARLLEAAPALVTGGTRAGLFAPPVPVPDTAGASDRLVAFLGRDPFG
ncbi:TIGR03086 family metal-binding protein [Actinomadura roseirufa]|uniref:TIGR03086 family metal-binding protein n=1 Tax=Actinomadura roseirufa TaxID=2094049 RepID=UPI001040F70D|nr:TIGR03086 family metal-binding protein [Actinomadura roseirufa]